MNKSHEKMNDSTISYSEFNFKMGVGVWRSFMDTSSPFAEPSTLFNAEHLIHDHVNTTFTEVTICH